VAFIAAHTSGFEAFAAGVARSTWEEIVERSGVDRATIEKTADIVARAKRMIVSWCLGLTQHPNGVENVEQVINLLLLGGHIGREGAGPCCVRGHSNVQGDRTMGIWEQPREAFLEALDRELDIRAPREHGYDSTECLHAMHDGRAKVFFGISGNLLSAAPDTHYAQRPSRGATSSPTCPRSSIATTSSRASRRSSCRASVARRGRSRGPAPALVRRGLDGDRQSDARLVRPDLEHLLSDVEILVRLAAATFGDESPVDWKTMLQQDRVREHIERVIRGSKTSTRAFARGPSTCRTGPASGSFTPPTARPTQCMRPPRPRARPERAS